MRKHLIAKMTLVLVGVVMFLHYLWLILIFTPQLKGTISEMERGIRADYDYINLFGEYERGLIKSYNMALELLDVPKELYSQPNFMVTQISKQEDYVKELATRIEIAKTNRSNLFSSFKYAKVVIPDEN